jgi:hypothetical protein
VRYALKTIAPNLLALRLDADGKRVPLLQSVPLLVTAYVRLDDHSRDRCCYRNFRQRGSDACVDRYGNPCVV